MHCSKRLQCLLYLLALVGVACTTGHCRRGENTVLERVDPKPPTGYEEKDLGSIMVAKSDGSLQCNQRDGISLESMAERDLKGIEVLASEKMNDGLMRIQVCGADTGMLNVYTIRHKDLRKAQKAGFTLFKTKEKAN